MIAVIQTILSRHSSRAFQLGSIKGLRPLSRNTFAVGYGAPNVRLFVTSDPISSKGKSQKKGKKGKEKLKVNKNITQENMDLMAQAFEELARREGFDPSTAHFADDATFEDDFKASDFEDDDDALDPDILSRLKEIEAEGGYDDDFDDNDFLAGIFDEEEAKVARASTSMESRIATAQHGKIDVSEELSNFAAHATQKELEDLGFKPESEPYDNDEASGKNEFKLVTNARTCPACGATFQSTNEHRPGYLPPEKHQIQMKLAKIEELQKLKAKVESREWNADAEIEYLIHANDGNKEADIDELASIDIEKEAEEMGLDLRLHQKKKIICKRCHGLQNSGRVDEALRPGWTDEPLLSQAKFRELLAPIREKAAVIIALVDLFDFNGSVLPELDSIAGENPVLLAANKADLLPHRMGKIRAENWVRRELEYMGIKSLANTGGAVRLVSCKTGFGIAMLLQKARALADDIDGDVYVVGAANAGKSTLINFILDKNTKKKQHQKTKFKKKRPGNANAKKGALTVSPLPGTTLQFIKVDLGDGRNLYDTPGLLVPGTLTQRLTPAELKIVVPKKPVEPVTFRVSSGKCVLVGGLAKIEVIGDTRPFLFTFYVANDIKLHPTDSIKAAEVLANHAGTLLTPPLEPGPERMKQIGEFEHHEIEIEGSGWKEAAADISLIGLGWVAVTGVGTARVRISVPKGVGIAVRPPLMPFDVWEVAAKYTGSRSVRKSGKTRTGKRRGGVGRN